MTEKWKSLEQKIREVARAGMQKKIEERDAKIRLTTELMKPVEIKEMAEEDVIELALDEADDYGKGKIFKHMDDSHDSHRLRMAHSVTAYDRGQEARAAKNPKAYHNTYALGHYLGAVDRAHSEMKKGTSPAEAINKHFNGALAKRLHKHLGTGGVDLHTQQKAAYNEEKSADKDALKKDKKVVKLVKDLENHEKQELKHEEVEEATAIQPNPEAAEAKNKMTQERDQVQKQKQQLRLQLAQQKAAKQMAAMKSAGEKSLEKVKEEKENHRRFAELTEWQIRTFNRAQKLEKLHQDRYTRFAASGDRAKAEMHRKKAIELKRLAYTAQDNPAKLPQ